MSATMIDSNVVAMPAPSSPSETARDAHPAGRSRLTLTWFVVDGRLTCRWMLPLEVDAPLARDVAARRDGEAGRGAPRDVRRRQSNVRTLVAV